MWPGLTVFIGSKTERRVEGCFCETGGINATVEENGFTPFEQLQKNHHDLS